MFSLIALDRMRCGRWVAALATLGIIEPDDVSPELPEGLITPRHIQFIGWDELDQHLEDQQHNVHVLAAAGL